MSHSTTQRARPAWLLLLVLGAASGCAGEATNDDAAESEDALRRGIVTVDAPQVGVVLVPDRTGAFAKCTATLVGPRSVLTAAHCVDFRSATVGSTNGTFTTYGSSGQTTRVRRVDGYVSYGSWMGSRDVALMHLHEPITDLTPLPLRRTEPSRGESVKLYGYGRNDCAPGASGGSSDGRKRVFTFAYGTQPHALCDGDSGGPTVTTGGIFQVSSYTTNWLFTETSSFGRVWQLYDTLSAQIQSWR